MAYLQEYFDISDTQFLLQYSRAHASHQQHHSPELFASTSNLFATPEETISSQVNQRMDTEDMR